MQSWPSKCGCNRFAYLTWRVTHVSCAQDAVKKLNEAQATLDNAHKAAAAQEAAVAAAEALHLWPSNARLVPSSHPNFPPTAPQLLHPDIAKLGSCLFSPPGGIASHALDDSHSMLSSVLDGAAADHVAGLGPNEGDGIGPTAGAAANNADSQQEQNCKHTQQLNGWQGGQPLTGWQRRLQSSMSQHQIQQVLCPRLVLLTLCRILVPSAWLICLRTCVCVCVSVC